MKIFRELREWFWSVAATISLKVIAKVEEKQVRNTPQPPPEEKKKFNFTGF